MRKHAATGRTIKLHHRAPTQLRPTRSQADCSFSFGLVIGALLMLGTLGYNMPTLGGLVLAALVVLAVWNAQRS